MIGLHSDYIGTIYSLSKDYIGVTEGSWKIQWKQLYYDAVYGGRTDWEILVTWTMKWKLYLCRAFVGREAWVMINAMLK